MDESNIVSVSTPV